MSSMSPADVSKLFHVNEEDIVDALSSTDLPSLSKELLENVAITKQAHEIFNSLDHDRLNSRTRARYLLSLMLERLQQGHNIHTQFCKVISQRSGACMHLATKLNQQLVLSSTPGSFFPETDLEFLIQFLISCSYKWEMLGTMLKLPEYVLRECDLEKTYELKLKRLLVYWLSGKYKDAKPATLQYLKVALESEPVAFKNLSTSLEKDYEAYLQSNEEHMFATPEETETCSIDRMQQTHNTYPQFYRVPSRACTEIDTCLNQKMVPYEFQKNRLHEFDLEMLFECIMECSHKWEELGTILGLPQRALENCKMEGSVELKLKKVLLEWLTGRYKNARNCTLKTLTEALKSPAVAFPSLSSGLEEALQIQHRPKRPKLGNDITSYSETVTGPIITFQSSDTKVADHKSALFEVQVRKSSESISYQWMRNRQPLSDTLPFSGTTTAMLLINQASLGAEGTYSCQVRCGLQLVETSPAELQIQYSKDKNILISQYSRYSEIPQNAWPLSNCNIFVDLTLIKNSKMKKPSHFVIEQEMEALLVEQEKINYDSAFGEHKTGTVILVEGRPGSGKTTLAYRIVKDWSQGKALKNADHVFLISLRRDLTRSQIFELFYHSLSQKYMEDIEESGGDKACFVLDGYDEFSPEDKNVSVIEDILNKKYLPESMVIITSRPEATVALRQKAGMRIEILGFTREQFQFYVNNYPFETSSDPTKEKKMRVRLQDYVKSCTNVLNICYLPVNASIICFLFSQHLGDIPPPITESQIYGKLVLAIVLCQLRVQNPLAHLCSLKDFTGQNKTMFSEICKLAYDMTAENKQTLCELPESLISLKDSPFRRLFILDHDVEFYGIKEVFSFVHLTLQEYLGACHLASLDNDHQMEVIEKHTAESYHMTTLLKFYCGLIQYNTNIKLLNRLIELIPKRNVLHLIHCAYESQEPELCKHALSIIQGIVEIPFVTLTPADFIALAYVISSAPLIVDEVRIYKCQLYEDCIDNIVEVRSLNIKDKFDHGITSFMSGHADIQALQNLVSYSTVSYKMKSIFIPVIGMLVEKQLHNEHYRNYKVHYMETLYKLRENDIMNIDTSHNLGYINAFTSALLKCTNLHIFNLESLSVLGNASIAAGLLKNIMSLKHLELCNITATTMEILGKGLQYSKNLESLKLVSSECDHEGSVALATGLQHCKSLRSLKITNIKLGPEDAAALAQGLKYLSLTSIFYVHCDIGNKGVLALAREGCFRQTKELVLTNDKIDSKLLTFLMKKTSKNISTLILADNHINSNGITEYVQNLNSCFELQHIHLQYNPIGPEGAHALGYGLNQCFQLSHLNLAGCNITSDGLPALVHGFQHWSRLLLLDLTENELCSKSMASLSEQLHMISSLMYLYLSHNNIDYRGAIALARGIQECPSIRVFNISHNNIGSIGAAAIASALKCREMDFVNFSNNSIDLENELLVIHLVALAERGKLQLLDLSQNQVGIDITIRLIICLIFNLRILNISTNNTPPEIVEFVTAFRKIATSAEFPKIYISN